MSLTINHQTNDISASSGSMTIDGSAVGGGSAGGPHGTLLQTINVSSGTTNIDVGSSSLFTTTYSHYRIVGTDMTLPGSDPYLWCRMRRGTTWDTTTNYIYSMLRIESNTTYSVGGGNQAGFQMSQYQYATSGYNGQYVVDLFNAGSTTYETIAHFKTLQINATAPSLCIGCGRYPHTDAITGVRLYRHMYNWAGGVVKLYGVG